MTRIHHLLGVLLAAAVLMPASTASFARAADERPPRRQETDSALAVDMQRRIGARPAFAGRPGGGLRPALRPARPGFRPGRPGFRPGRPGSLPHWGPPGTRPTIARPPGRLPAWGPPGTARPPGWRPDRPIVGRPLPPAGWRPWRPGLRWIVATGVVTAATAARLRWCHVHTYASPEMIFHSDVRCHRHQDWDHPSLRYVYVP